MFARLAGPVAANGTFRLAWCMMNWKEYVICRPSPDGATTEYSVVRHLRIITAGLGRRNCRALSMAILDGIAALEFFESRRAASLSQMGRHVGMRWS